MNELEPEPCTSTKVGDRSGRGEVFGDMGDHPVNRVGRDRRTGRRGPVEHKRHGRDCSGGE
ncbi:hypothetical protein, partial [Glycomyces tenuis]|uniref:hypothetical protein n=1 Tax=Glycomyces tenuis TaxID=58116 RepID=UPI001B7FF99C